MKEPFLNERKRDFDWPLLAAAAALVVIGVLFIFSASGEAAQDLPFYRQKFFLQIVWCIVGVGAAAALCMIDYIKVARWAIVLYWVSIILLLAVLVLGKMVNGGRRWVTVLGFGMQPSEFAKISFIFLMAHYLSRPAEELRRPRVFFGVLGYTVLPFLLILKEPDLGSSLVFLSMCLALMFVAGVPKRFLIPLIATGAACVALVVGAVLLTSPSQTGKVVTAYQRKNILNFLGLATDYNVSQALISVGSGGFFGKGWRHGTQHQLGFLPSKGAHNDFIFSVIGEEEGFVGSVVILTLYSVLLFSGIKIASRARDRLGQLLAVGVVTLLFSHVFINIGMNIRIMPVAGIPLPLVSYGGSSVVCSLIAIGVLHNVHIYRRSY